MSQTDPARLGAAASARPARVAHADGPVAAARHARARGLLVGHAQGRERQRLAGRSAALRQAPGGLCGCRSGADVRRLAAGLLALARVALPALRHPAGLDHRRARPRAGHARCEVVDRAAVLQPAAIRARQGPAGRGLGGLPGGANARDGAAHDRARDAARPDPDDDRDGRARPRVGHGLRRRHARHPVRGGRAVAPFRGAAGAVRGQRDVRAGRGAEARRRGAASPTRCRA